MAERSATTRAESTSEPESSDSQPWWKGEKGRSIWYAFLMVFIGCGFLSDQITGSQLMSSNPYVLRPFRWIFRFLDNWIGGIAFILIGIIWIGTVWQSGKGANPVVTKLAGDQDWPKDQDWPQDRFNSANTCYAPNAMGPIQNIRERWCFQPGGSVLSGPVVANGTVYVANEDSIYALDSSDGTECWHFQTRNPVGTPAVTNGTVYVTNEDSVYALDASDGAERWHSDIEGFVDSSLTLANSTVYVGTDKFDTTSKMYALDSSDGTECWHFQTRNPVGTPAVTNGTVYVTTTGNYVYALDSSDGTKRWHFRGTTICGIPMVVNGTVYFGMGKKVYALDSSDGTECWHFQPGGSVLSGPVVANDTIYGVSGDNVYARDASNGAEHWHSAIGGFVDNSTLVVTNSSIYVANEDSVYALDSSDGTECWHFQTNSFIRGSPAVANGTVYVSTDNNVSAIESEPHLS